MARRFGRSNREELVASLPPVWHVGFAVTSAVFMFLFFVPTLPGTFLFLMAGVVTVLARMVWLARVDRSGKFRREGFHLSSPWILGPWPLRRSLSRLGVPTVVSWVLSYLPTALLLLGLILRFRWEFRGA